MSQEFLYDGLAVQLKEIEGLAGEPIIDSAVMEPESAVVRKADIFLPSDAEKIFPVLAPVLKLKQLALGDAVSIGYNCAVFLGREVLPVGTKNGDPVPKSIVLYDRACILISESVNNGDVSCGIAGVPIHQVLIGERSDHGDVLGGLLDRKQAAVGQHN